MIVSVDCIFIEVASSCENGIIVVRTMCCGCRRMAGGMSVVAFSGVL